MTAPTFMNFIGDCDLSPRMSRYLRRKLAGLCVDCAAGLPDDADSVRCVECMERHASNQRRYLDTPRGRKKQRANQTSRRHARGDAGLCTRCGRRPEIDGARLCNDCRYSLNEIRSGQRTSAPLSRLTRFPTLRAEIRRYQPLDEREQNMRVRVLRALDWLTHDGEHVDSQQIFLAARVDDSGDSREHNGAQVTLGRLVRLGLVDRVGEPVSFRYRVTDAGRAEVKRYRAGDLPARRRAG